MRFQPIYDIAELCAKKGLKEIVLCPGSRCAPLTLAFTRHKSLHTRTFSDERSAAFVALGMSQVIDQPVVVVCTSGTAVYNLAPAVAEAFFSQTPLVIITADRPAEWIAQHDGQTIYQSEIFGKHVKKYFQLPQEYEHPDNQWAINRIINEAVNLSQLHPPGPVHINAPFREPLYPEKGEDFLFTPNLRVVEHDQPVSLISEKHQNKIRKDWDSYHNILVVAGQHPLNPLLTKSLAMFSQKHEVPVVTDIISNLHELEKGIKHADLFLGQAPDDVKEKLWPDLIITFGQSLISKNTKLFLRKFTAKAHWHIQENSTVADTFKNVTNVFHTSPKSFFDLLNSFDLKAENKSQTEFHKNWKEQDQTTQHALHGYLNKGELSEFSLVKEVTERLPPNCNLHLANSMSVRYANFIGLKASQKDIQVFANRGTSGIDGCTSTAVGHCLASGKPTFLITGDLAFFYDRNAFWHNYPLANFRVLLLNNHGGLIFNVIDGPASLPEAQEYFITRQSLNAKKLCEEFGYQYLKAESRSTLPDLIDNFFAFDGKTKIMELDTDVHLSKEIFNDLKQKIKKSYEL